MPERDSQIWVEARRRLPLPALMAKIGDGEFAKANTTCPFCQRQKKFGIFLSNGRHKFKCHHTSCVANEPEFGRNEIGYLALRKSLPLKEAQQEYLRLAVPELIDESTHRPRPPRRVVPVDFAAGGAAPPDDPGDAPKNPWDDLWRRLILNTKDRAEIVEQRGLSEETIERAGIRSNNESNLFHLTALGEIYPPAQLIAEGIYKSDERSVRPQGQLYGYGITKRKGPDGKTLKGPDGRPVFEVTEPPLIPYFDRDGAPYYMRPHKGGVKRPKDETEDTILYESDAAEDEARQCGSHPYCPPRLGELVEVNDGLVIFTEGEWKALACEEAGLAAIACPGITFIRNAAFKRELLAVLRIYGVTDMVVIFDNEDKSNPEYPGRFVADPWKRCETQVYAEIVAIDLREYFDGMGGSCRTGKLPDDFRVEGKADFDGILAKLVREQGREAGVRAARRVFLDAVRQAQDRPTLELFPTEQQRIIEWRLEQVFHVPLVSIGGDAEMKLAQRFGQVNPKTGQPVDAALAALYRSLRGCYYQRLKPKPPPKSEDLLTELDRHIEELQKSTASDAHQQLTLAYAAKAAIWERRKGLPDTISDFTLVCEYQLMTVEGTLNRLVRVRNKMTKGPTNTTLYRLTPDNLERCTNFRNWGYGLGEPVVWKGGEIALQELVQDMTHHSYQRKIFEVDLYGFHPASKMWFYGDCAWTAEARCIRSDDRGIFWHEGIGYQVDANVLERGTAFAQGAPLMLAPQQDISTLPALENPDLRAMFSKLAQDMHDTIGGYDGWLALGMMFAYGAAPELMRKGGHPGLFMYGAASGGKTTIMRWLLHIWGFPLLGGTGLDDRTTHVAMNRLLTQYSSLPLWFDEYRKQNITPEKEAVLRGAFDRGHGEKGVASPTKRTQSYVPMTTPAVTGENSSNDMATRSRYGHVMVAGNRRIGESKERYDRLQHECRHFYLFGRFIMEHRPEFVEKCLGLLDLWMTMPEVRPQILNERVRFVHGVAFAAYVTLAEMLGVNDTEGYEAYMRFLIEHGRRALVDVVEEGFLNTFWREVISGMQRSAIKRGNIEAGYYRVNPETGALTHVNANQSSEAVHLLYLASNSLYAEYERDLRSRGKEPPHSEADLRREMEKEAYWQPPPKSPPRVHRKRLLGSQVSCWVVSLERKRQADGSEDETAPYLFPFAEEVISLLVSDKEAFPHAP